MEPLSASEILKQNKSKVLKLWEEEVRRNLPVSSQESSSSLKDSLPSFIDDLVDALKEGLLPIKTELFRVASKHGSERANLSGYSLEEALEEFNILRKSIFKVLENHIEVAPRERDVIYEVINIGFAKAGTEFSKMQLRKENEAKELAQKRLIEKVEAERKLALTLNASKVGLWELDLQKKEVTCSPEEIHLLELPVMSHRFPFEITLSVICKEDLPKINEAIQNAQLTHHYQVDLRVIKHDGSIRWISSKGEYLPAENKIIGTDIDITTRKEAEEVIAKAAQQLKEIADIQPTLIGLVGTDLRYKFLNKQYHEWLGIDPEEGVGKTIEEVVGKDFFREISPMIQKALKGEQVTAEKYFSFGNEEKYVKLLYQPQFDSNKKVTGFYVSVVDLSEQIATLKELEKREEEFRTLSNAIPQITWMGDSDGSIYWFNERWYEYTGAEKKDSLGWEWKKFQRPEFVAQKEKEYEKALKNGISWEDTFEIRNKNGEWRWFLSRGLPVKGKRGEIIKWIGTLTDVTDQKNLFDRLQHEQSMRDRFISTLSHDLRTPLTAAKMASQLILRKAANNDFFLTQSQRIIKSINRADKMIQDLLDASRINAGQLIKPELSDFDVIELLTEVVNDLSAIHGERFHLYGKGLQVHSWPTGLTRIIENLSSNAIKYGSPDAPIEIEVMAHESTFSVSVHNFGTPVEKEANLFEAFKRTSSAEKSGKRGWGIGLAIVKALTQSLGGNVQVHRHSDGTTFEITLPKDSSTIAEEKEQQIRH